MVFTLGLSSFYILFIFIEIGLKARDYAAVGGHTALVELLDAQVEVPSLAL